MFKLLNKKEIEKFTKKYLPNWLGDIIKVSQIEYDGTKEYLVNDHYLIIVKKNKVIHKDLQFDCL